MTSLEDKSSIKSFESPESDTALSTTYQGCDNNNQMTFLQNNSPTAPRGLTTELSGSRVSSPILPSPSNSNRMSVSSSPGSVTEQINVGGLTIDHSMTDTTQLTFQNANGLTTRGRTPVRDAGVDSIPTPVRCINPASGTFVVPVLLAFLMLSVYSRLLRDSNIECLAFSPLPLSPDESHHDRHQFATRYASRGKSIPMQQQSIRRQEEIYNVYD